MLYEPYTIEEVKKAGEQKLFTVISTFAGGGGSSTGYKLAGGTLPPRYSIPCEANKSLNLSKCPSVNSHAVLIVN